MSVLHHDFDTNTSSLKKLTEELGGGNDEEARCSGAHAAGVIINSGGCASLTFLMRMLLIDV